MATSKPTRLSTTQTTECFSERTRGIADKIFWIFRVKSGFESVNSCSHITLKIISQFKYIRFTLIILIRKHLHYQTCSHNHRLSSTNKYKIIQHVQQDRHHAPPFLAAPKATTEETHSKRKLNEASSKDISDYGSNYEKHRNCSPEQTTNTLKECLLRRGRHGSTRPPPLRIYRP